MFLAMPTILHHSLFTLALLFQEYSPMSDNTEVIAAVVGAVVGTIGTAVITITFSRGSRERENATLSESLRNLQRNYQQKQAELDKLSAEVERFKPLADRYIAVRKLLESSSVVRTHYQPVLLLGPRAVGKTSLVMQWHAPWDYSRLDPTPGMRHCDVPIYDYQEAEAEPHFADPSVRTQVNGHLLLRVFDFPGELTAQAKVREIAVRETERLKSTGKKNLGIVLICMFAADEAFTGISTDTREYWNGELFRELRYLFFNETVKIERVIFVLNRYDLLRAAVGEGQSDDELMTECLKRLERVYAPLYEICNKHRMCATFTVLSRENIRENNRGAPIVLGEAARAFVSSFAGQGAAEALISDFATPVHGPFQVAATY
jgi:hypothetical protein